MTASALLTEATRLGIVLDARGETLHVEAPAGVLTSELRAALTRHKPAVLDILWRLDGMRQHPTPIPTVRSAAESPGGPGHCFSCGAPLGHPRAYGRCDPCWIAVELYYSTSDGSTGHSCAVAFTEGGNP